MPQEPTPPHPLKILGSRSLRTRTPHPPREARAAIVARAQEAAPTRENQLVVTLALAATLPVPLMLLVRITRPPLMLEPKGVRVMLVQMWEMIRIRTVVVWITVRTTLVR